MDCENRKLGPLILIRKDAITLILYKSSNKYLN